MREGALHWLVFAGGHTAVGQENRCFPADAVRRELIPHFRYRPFVLSAGLGRRGADGAFQAAHRSDQATGGRQASCQPGPTHATCRPARILAGDVVVPPRMTGSRIDASGAPDRPGGPNEIEFFLDPIWPFAWQTSVWIRRVARLRGLSIGWRFISLFVIHEPDENPTPESVSARRRSLEFLRVLDAVRTAHGNDQVGRLYEAWGQQLWYDTSGRSSSEAPRTIDIAALVQAQDLPAGLAGTAADRAHDVVIRAETALAFERAGGDLGTPIISYDPPHGSSFLGPVISSVPSDEQSLALYDTLRSHASFADFAELKRTSRPRLDLPIFNR